MEYLYFLQNLREASGGFFDNFFLAVKNIGNGTFSFLFLAIVYWCIDKRCGQLIAMNIAFASWLNQWIKKALKIERPWIRDSRLSPVKAAIDDATGYAMPAGNTQRAIASFGVFFKWTKRKAVKYLLLGVLLLLMFSGSYLGTNTIADQLVSLIIGLFVIFICDGLLEWVEDEGKGFRDIILVVFCILVFFVPVQIFGHLSNLGTSIGLMTGWLLERRFVNFDMPSCRKTAVLRAVFGLAVVYFVCEYTSNFLSYIVPYGYESFAINLFVSLFIIYLYPIFFQNWEHSRRKAALKGSLAFAGGLALIIASIELSNFLDFKAVSCLVIADNGYSAIAPKGSMDSLEAATDIGTNMVKLDVQLTEDKKLVVFEDKNLREMTGAPGIVAGYTLEELEQLPLNNNFYSEDSSLSAIAQRENYSSTRVLSLREALSHLELNTTGVYINILAPSPSLGLSVEEYMRIVYKEVNGHYLLGTTIYGSDDYSYLQALKEIDESVDTLYYTSGVGINSVLYNCPANYYAIDINSITGYRISAIKNAGAYCIAENVCTPQEMTQAVEYGVDGMVTSDVGQAIVLVNSKYRYLSDSYVSSMTVPTIYDGQLQKGYKNFILQGMTKVRKTTVLSAYDSTRQRDSVLYLMSETGQLTKIIDLGFKAHVGGIAYDESRDLLWITAARGQVYALSWPALLARGKVDIVYRFDAQLYNQSGSHVASFLAIDEDELYVGSYCVGQTGLMKSYQISELIDNGNSQPTFTYSIPEKVQGVTFYRDESLKYPQMILAQCEGYRNSTIIVQQMDGKNLDYTDKFETYTIPGMVEQPYMDGGNLMLLFESSAKLYRAIYRVPNDQIWTVKYN